MQIPIPWIRTAAFWGFIFQVFFSVLAIGVGLWEFISFRGSWVRTSIQGGAGFLSAATSCSAYLYGVSAENGFFFALETGVAAYLSYGEIRSLPDKLVPG